MKFLQIINKLKKNQLSPAETNFLARSLYNISLYTVRHKIKEVISSKHSLNYTDLIKEISNDAVSTLFEPVKNSNQPSLINSLQSWNHPITNEAEAEYFVNKVVWNRVSQTLIGKLKELDPVFAKIHHNLSMTVKKYSYNKIVYFGTVYIIREPAFTKIKPLLKEKDMDDFPAVLFTKNSHQVLKDLFEHIDQEGRFQPAIPANLLVKRMKNLLIENFDTVNCTYPEAVEDRLLMKDAIDQAYSGIKEILNNYAASDKIDFENIEIFTSIFSKLSADLLNGGIRGSLFYYMNEHKKDLSRDEFYSIYHRRLSYLYDKYMSKIKSVLELN